ncbi:putative two-component system, histidine kinase [Halobacteriovorax marinus SJ]|uniref:histidine kinase n=1 Tax=Halobacteriovorax marinus (strain ATCC BAA-682 / DSM 15412 / SJ) TaxID=862908 RepID=E1X623_HALMS|nr:ATP-binding protein [Halobacteriovorax marinus]CBW27367.1 putative two-component system, histidine kinase [Halobacteriovorax marinus SJ]
MNEKPRSHLSFELLKWILICSTFFTFLGAGVQLYTDYKSGLRVINSTLSQIKDSYVQSMSNSLWNLDDEQISIQIKGIKKLKDIQYIKVSERRNNTFKVYSEVGEYKDKNVIEQEYTLEYRNGDNVNKIGKLQVQATLDGLFSRLFDKILVILITQTVKTFIVSFCILYIIHVLVSKKIMTLVSFAKQLRIKNLDAPISIDRESNKLDEIDELAKSMNQMRVHLKLSVDKMKRSEKNIIEERDYSNGLINGSPYIICGLTPKGIVNFLNPVGLNITGVKRNEIIGRDFFKTLGIEGNERGVKEFLDESKFTEVKDFILPLKSKRGTEVVINWSTLLRRNAEGDIIEIIGFGSDITQKHFAEKELKRYQQQLEVLVEKRTAEVEQKNVELSENLDELKNMQTRLVAQEKLASLGSLTSGIAHELNNPLNFVINFSQASQESCSDIAKELESKTPDFSEVKESLDELKEFSNMIHMHGKRAETIIRSMLDHSRSKESEKSLEEVNNLIEENVNFAFHAIKAKYHGFNAKITLRLEDSLPKAELAKGEFGRVLLNMFTNAFYSMNLRKEQEKDPYEAELIITSLQDSKFIIIKIRDNGIGIEKEKLKDVFDPFYTTKPTGEGTGLGLSLSHEIIVGVHQGELDIDSELGEFAEFTIKLPKKS